MGWHDKLGIKRLWPLVQGQRVERLPGDDPLFLRRGTVNFKAMARAGELIRAFRYGTLGQQADALAACRRYLVEQFRDGLLSNGSASEQGCGDPHLNYHLAALGAMRLAAVEFKLAELLDLTGRCYRWHLSYFRTVATPDGQVLGPGFRGKGGPWAQVADMVLREVDGLRHLGPVGPGEGGEWNEWRFAGAGLVRRLLRDGDDLGGAAATRKNPELVHLKVPLSIERSAVGHLAVLAYKNVPPRAVYPIDWVRVIYGKPGDHQVDFGKDWATPPLELPANQLKAERIQ